MNYSTLAVIADEKVRLIRCQFSDSGTLYTYKTLDNSIKVGDMVVCEFSGTKDFKTCEVIEVDTVADLNDNITYKWAFQRIDIELLKNIKEAEKELITNFRKKEVVAQRAQLREALGVDFQGSMQQLLEAKGENNG